MKIGVRLALDIGKARIGVAKSDAHGILASPYTTVKRSEGSASHIADLVRLIEELEPLVIYIGDPKNLKGRDTLSTHDALEIAGTLSERGFNVRLIDERFTTVQAQSLLHAGGRNTKESRQVIDMAAAAVILESALNLERASGAEAGYAI